MLSTVPHSGKQKIFRDVAPVFSAIGASLCTCPSLCPPRSGLPLWATLVSRKSLPGIFHADVVGGDPPKSAGGFVVARQVGTDDLPAIAAIAGDVHKLAAHVDLFVVVGRIAMGTPN